MIADSANLLDPAKVMDGLPLVLQVTVSLTMSRAGNVTIIVMNAADVASELDEVVATSRPRLLAIAEEAAGRHPAAGKWSKKEILGHLIDSASNNHQRFVRLQWEDALVFPAYQQNQWVSVQHYDRRPWRDLVELWLAFNRHLAHVMRHSDAAAAAHVWKAPGGDAHLQFVMEDYVEHLRHHVEQLLA